MFSGCSGCKTIEDAEKHTNFTVTSYYIIHPGIGLKIIIMLLDWRKQMRILAIGAHSDDVDQFCGGTLARYAALGHIVGICCVTDGRANGAVEPVEALVATRKKEFETTAGMIGATQTYWLGFPDGELENNLATRRTLVQAFEDFKPDVLLTHPLDDYHPDHIATHHLVIDASLATWFEGNTFAVLYFWESEGGHNYIPDEYVDITQVYDLKLRLIDVHRSQWDYGPDPETGKPAENFIIPDVHAMALFRGMQSSVKYAEAFQHSRKYGRLRTFRVLP